MLESMYNKALLSFVVFSSIVFADAEVDFPPPNTNKVQLDKPFFTGPLLTGSASVITDGNANIEPYLYVTDSYGGFDANWHPFKADSFFSEAVSIPIQVGINKYCDIEIIPGVSNNRFEGVSDFGISDTGIGAEFQLHQDGKSGIPVKLSIVETLPTGVYEGLKPGKNGTDIHGEGAFETNIILAAAKLFHIKGIHYLNTRMNLIYAFAPPTTVKGLNAYGGALDTNGKIKPGNEFQALVGLEYSFTKKFSAAFDFYFITSKKNKFVGNPGHNLDGTMASVGNPSFEQISIAPELEYNFTANVGIIGGVWFTLAGRNSSQFVSGVIALNWYITNL